MSGTKSTDELDRARGVLVGMALGDAFGAPVEFDPPESIAGRREELRELPGGGSFRWAPGEFTDDTQMAITLARHLLEHDLGIAQDELARAFCEWATHPATADVGIQTRRVLSAVSRGVDWRKAVSELDPESAGNGSLMRVAPVALAGRSRGDVLDLARLQSEVTHPNRWCVDAGRVFALAVYETLTTGSLPALRQLEGSAIEPEVRTAILRAEERTPPLMSGFVLHTLSGALWAVFGADDFEEAVWRATSLGRDADTVAAVAGALAGAYWGRSGISDSLAARLSSTHPLLKDRTVFEIEALAISLASKAEGRKWRGDHGF